MRKKMWQQLFKFMVTEKQIQHITNIIVDTVHPQKIYLFGSYAKGNATDNSDLDFLVIMPNSKQKKIELAHQLFNKTKNIANISKDIIIEYKEKYDRFCNIDYSFIGHIVKTGNLLYAS